MASWFPARWARSMSTGLGNHYRRKLPAVRPQTHNGCAARTAPRLSGKFILLSGTQSARCTLFDLPRELFPEEPQLFKARLRLSSQPVPFHLFGRDAQPWGFICRTEKDILKFYTTAVNLEEIMHVIVSHIPMSTRPGGCGGSPWSRRSIRLLWARGKRKAWMPWYRRFPVSEGLSRFGAGVTAGEGATVYERCRTVLVKTQPRRPAIYRISSNSSSGVEHTGHRSKPVLAVVDPQNGHT